MPILLLLLVLVLMYWGALEYLGLQWKAIPDINRITQDQSTAETAPATADQVPTANVEGAAQNKLPLSVVVVVRNEAHNLPFLFRSLDKQSLSHNLFELHLVDDASTDESWALAESLSLDSNFSVNLHKLEKLPTGGSPKKAAISQVLPLAKGELIVVTDGDCIPEPDWLSSIYKLWRKHNSVFISGPVRYVEEQNLFEQLQALDFAALIGVGAAMLQSGKPGMCNAANMAFSKKAFFAVGGYQGNEQVPSGDDEFLLQKLSHKYPRRINFLKTAGAIVSTGACGSWQHFVHQRKRWAGKWRLHKGYGPKLLAIGVFLFYLLLAASLVVPVLNPALLSFTLLILLLKGIADYRFLLPIFHFLKKPLSLKVFLLLELVYPFYVLFFAVAANVGSFTWKERSYRYTTSAHERTGISSVG